MDDYPTNRNAGQLFDVVLHPTSLRLRNGAGPGIMGLMERSLELNGLTAKVTADSMEETPGGLLIKGQRVTLALPRPPTRYLRHGWQSWSLAAWTDLASLPVQQPPILHPMQVDPQYVTERLPNGSWFGAVEFNDGKVLLLGALGLETHVRLNGDRLEGWSESGPVEWFASYGDERSIFDAYAARLGKALGQAPQKPAPHIWCSWYSLYTAIDEPLLNKIFDELADFPFDVLQVDDGWQVSIGDWEPNAKFPSGMTALASGIRARGRRAGLWLAPLIATGSSRLFREHPDWFLKDSRGRFVSAGFNWGQPLFALDTTHPEALDWLKKLMQQVRAWGFSYLKLDFLYAGALPGKRYQDMPREAAFRQGLKALREGMGADAYFLVCGSPIFPSLGLCDALRVGPDVSGEWESHRDAVLLANPTTPGTRNAIRTTLHQLWLSPLVQVDPDVAYFARQKNVLTPEQKRLLKDLALICGFKATSDLPQWLGREEREDLLNFLEEEIKPIQTGRYRFDLDGRSVDFSDACALPEPARRIDRLQGSIMSWLADQPWALRIFDRMNKNNLEKIKRELLAPPSRPEKSK